MPGDPIGTYTAPVNSVGIYLAPLPLPSDVFPVALEETQDHANMIMQGCRLLWGSGGHPLEMSGDGQTLFLNSVAYMRFFQCAPQEPPPCVTIDKTAVPPDGTPVAPGDVIEYTITYTYSDDAACQHKENARIVDTVPLSTTFVPGSATDGISPGADGSLVWSVPPAAGAQTKTFKVLVTERACNEPQLIRNRAGLLVPGYAPVISNVTTHPVQCPPVGLPNDGPSYAQEEITITPYPLRAGLPSQVKVRLVNNTTTPQTVNVRMQISPNIFGIGLDFVTFSSSSAMIPANGTVEVSGVLVPAVNGHYCIQIFVTGPGLTQPLVSQRNIDVTEDLQPGVADTLTFKVRNNTAAAGDIQLVVENTCPGWMAMITDPAGGVLINMAVGEIRTASLEVTPPNPVTLGSGCHIDVTAWINGQMIGGIRKLDVPPVQLPGDVNPPWEEPEISFRTDPPVAGQPNQICVELQNPLPVTKTVTIDYSVADFGAGIGFTPVGSLTFDLPPNSLGKYCIDWTPATSGTLHRCVLVTLNQANYQPMHSQRNVDIRRVIPGQLGTLDIPFLVGNPDLVDHTLLITYTLVGIDPYWMPQIVDPLGDPPPLMLMGGENRLLRLLLLPAAGLNGAAAPDAAPLDYHYGDVSKIEVEILLDGRSAGGFSVQLETPRVYLPLVSRQ